MPQNLPTRIETARATIAEIEHRLGNYAVMHGEWARQVESEQRSELGWWKTHLAQLERCGS